jgi:hypothetical protein
MKFIRPILTLTALLLIVAVASFWWNRPTKADMADYVPADSLIYIEINSINDIINAINKTDVWKAVSPSIGLSNQPNTTSHLLAARLGLAPIQAVLASRAQMALVIVGVNTAEQDDLLRVKPEVALVVETHTSKWRMKSAAIEDIKHLAEFAYGTSACTERSADVDYVECLEPKGSRKIIGAIDGTIMIIGNSEKAVDSCLAVRRGQRPSLHTDVEMVQLRRQLRSDSNLSFGYVSQKNAARLISLGGPLLLGRAPDDRQLERLLNDSASKILRSIAWTSSTKSGAIEDHYQISLDPDVIKHLGPAFQTSSFDDDFWKMVPASFRSVTLYRSNSPQAAWSSLDSAVASKLDAVSSVIFATVLKSGLSGYGIEDPRKLITVLEAPVLTIRPTLGESSLLVARVKDEEAARRELTNAFLKDGKTQVLNGIQSDPDRAKEFTAVFLNGFLLLGKTESVMVYLAQLRNNEVLGTDRAKTLTQVVNEDAGVVTYNNDRNSIINTIAALSRIGGRRVSDAELAAISDRISQFEVSSTESTLNSNGIERRTKSAFGQFGSLISFAQADSANSIER